ncbi:hypothetical protein ACM3NY_19860, partial [Aeromonas veronii]|uniref:hypothetical protein n=1 Tax=Aeromonas veronii TaxID=654 RepID=UPI0039F65338
MTRVFYGNKVLRHCPVGDEQIGGEGGGGQNAKSPLDKRNAVHLSGAALRSTGKRVFDIFTALGLDGLGRFS